MIWKIFIVKIYFTDYSGYKNRPVLVVWKKENDCLCLPITSNDNWRWIVLSNLNLESWELKKRSFILLKPYLLSIDLFEIKEKARISKKYLQMIKEKLCKFYWC